MDKWLLSDLENLIKNKVEENLNLEYKAADALQLTPEKKKEISKDVSAMANSAGGVIIYGIKESISEKHLPAEIEPINRKSFSKEWLEQVINSNIQPRIHNIFIDPIEIDNNRVAYRIIIPQSDTPHQANDKKYYKRYNFQSIPMEHYEIKDIFNRVTHPKVIMEFNILKDSYERQSTYDMMHGLGGLKSEQKKEIIHSTKLEVYFKNIGRVYANYINGFLFVPLEVIDSKKDYQDRINKINGIDYVRLYFDNIKRDVVGSKSLGLTFIPEYGPGRYVTLLPSRSYYSDNELLKNDLENNKDSILFWETYADNAEVIKGEILLSDISIKDKS